MKCGWIRWWTNPWGRNKAKIVVRPECVPTASRTHTVLTFSGRKTPDRVRPDAGTRVPSKNGVKCNWFMALSHCVPKTASLEIKKWDAPSPVSLHTRWRGMCVSEPQYRFKIYCVPSFCRSFLRQHSASKTPTLGNRNGPKKTFHNLWPTATARQTA